MIVSAVTAVSAITVVLTVWLAIQRYSAGLSGITEHDALAGRLGCTGCQCHAKCKNEDDPTPPLRRAGATRNANGPKR